MKMKVTFMTLVFALAMTTIASAQLEVKLNPIGALFGSPDVSVEYGVAPDFGVEGTVSLDFNNYTFGGVKYRNTGFGFRASGKYYFNPNDSIDKWYAGIYTKFRRGNASVTDDNSTQADVKSTRLAVGLLFGHKWVTGRNIVFEVNAGFGRAFISKFEEDGGDSVSTDDIPLLNWDVVGSFSVGYRFGNN